MKKAMTLVLALGLVTFMAGGCESAHEHDGHDHGTEAAITLCGGCGHVKGTEACCADGATTCAGCSLHKGSPGCCKITKGTDAALCGCGAVKGSDQCCNASLVKCAGCGKIKGTPGCCAGSKK